MHQPFGATAGSFFKNPKKISAGELLEKCGFRGEKSENGAVEFSKLHSNFLVNCGGATQNEILNFVQNAKRAIFEKTKILLENEVKIIDEFGEGIEI